MDTNQGRSAFLIRTYLHLLGAIALFVLFEVIFFSSGAAEPISRALLSVSWLVVIGALVLVAWLASHTAYNVQNPPAAYAALAFYVLAEALINVPLIYSAERAYPGTVATGAALTGLGFVTLTIVVWQTGNDFSFLRPFLLWAGLVALLLIVVSVLFAGNLGPIFAVLMVGYAGAAILYDTSNVLRDFPADRHVAAALELFASIALLFWYIIISLVEKSDP